MSNFRRDFYWTAGHTLPGAIFGSYMIFRSFTDPSTFALAIASATAMGWLTAMAIEQNRDFEHLVRDSLARPTIPDVDPAMWDALSAMGRDQLAKIRAEEASRP